MKTGNRTMAYFSIDILFSEALDFNLEEIAEAVCEDYPLAAVEVHPVNKGKHVQTDQVVLAMLRPLDTRNGHVVLMNGAGAPDEEFRTADHSEIAWRSGGYAHCALNAIKSHKSYITLSVQTSDHSLVGQFRAVRQLMAVSAVFAQLPISLSVLVHWSSHMIAASTWVTGVQKAMRSEWPLSEWFSFRCGWDVKKDRSQKKAVGYTKGLRDFLGYELHVAAAPIEPSDVKRLLRQASLAALTGEKLRDSDALGLDNGLLRYKAHRPRNADGALGPVMVLLHPDVIHTEQSQNTFKIQTKASTRHFIEHRPNPDFMSNLFATRA